jgi:hypothetical protein
MPTAARLIAAICLAMVGYIISKMIMPLMLEGTNFGYFVPLNMVLGLVVGWTVMGRRAGRGITAAINNGLTGIFVLMLWGLIVQSSYEMFRRAMRNRYDGPLEALAAIFEIGVEYSVMIATTQIGLTLLLASIVSGLATEYGKRRWP